MSDPIIQAAWKRGRWLLAGVGFVVAVVTAIRNANAIATPVALWGITLCVTVWLLSELLARFGLIMTRLPGSDHRMRITSLGGRPRCFFIGVLLVLALPTIINLFGSRASKSQAADVTVEEKRYPQ